eukprot:Skav211003  [mRNA]  locus=scaffold1610:94452:115803:- [translate_table: standard]
MELSPAFPHSPGISAEPGQPFSGVFHRLEQIDEKLTRALEIGRQMQVLLDGVEWVAEVLTIHHLILVDSDLCLFGSSAHTLAIPCVDSPAFSPEIVELCAGMGSMGTGPSFVGGRVIASVDSSPLACSHLTRNQHGQVIQGNLLDSETSRQLHLVVGSAHPTFLLGFPCQPHSRQGHGLGQQDSRSQVLWAALKTVYLMRAQALIVECVPEAAEDAMVIAALTELARIMGWSFHQCQLKHDHVWPAARHRWWGVLCPSHWNSLDFVTWPRLRDLPCISHVLPGWGLWSHDEEHQLMLTSEEWELYTDSAYGAENRMLSPSQVCPTLLHSYGNVCGPCPCGCRSTGISKRSLLNKGLRGKLVKSCRTNMPRLLHPKEASALMALPMSIEHDLDLRSALCLIGNIACPLQSLWSYLFLINVAAPHFPDIIPLDPLQTLRAYRAEILAQIRGQFPFAETQGPHDFAFFSQEGTPVHLLSCGSTSIAQLLDAEAINLGWGERMKFVDSKGVPLCTDFTAIGRPEALVAVVSKSKQVVDKPEGLLVVVLNIGENSRISFVTPGAFLFEVLWEHGLSTALRFTDVAGTFFSPDYRLWRSYVLVALTPCRFPTVRRPFTPVPLSTPVGSQSSSAGGIDLGLDSVAIWEAMLDLRRSVPCLMLHPEQVDSLLAGTLDLNLLPSLDFSLSVCLIFRSEGHWGFLFGQPTERGFCWSYFDGLAFPLASVAHVLAMTISSLSGLGMLSITCQQVIRQMDTVSCGTVAVLHMAYALGLRGSFSDDQVARLHRLLSCRNHKQSWMAYGPSVADIQAQLAAVLSTKGVPLADTADRASSAIQKLGGDAIFRALQDSNPWRALKALADKPGNRFQFVLRSELQAFVDTRAKQKHGAEVSIRKKEKSRGRKDKPFSSMDPRHLELDVAQFRDADEDLVEQIPLSDVKAEARGIALCTKAEAQPFIADPQSISTDALALLVIEDVPTKDRGQANAETVRFPVVYVPTQDPLLLTGCLIQLGDVEITRSHNEVEMYSLDIGDTQVLKIQMFRDELGQDWKLVMEAPVKFLIARIPLFRLCTSIKCDHKCGMTHAAVEDNFDQIIHEIWGRRFQSLDGRTIASDRADVFQVFVRIAAPVLMDLLRFAVEGIYLEPRAGASKATDPDFAVVWLPGATREIAVHKMKLVSLGLSLVRMKHRFGIRVQASNEAQVYKELRPGDSFMKIEVKYVYRLHPLPHGLQRAQLVKILKEWEWQARPLQPVKGSSEGGAWEVGTATQPTTPVKIAQGRDVLLTLVKDKTVSAAPPVTVMPRRVQKHLQTQASSSSAGPKTGSDPWQLYPAADPWMAGRSSQAGAAPTAAAQTRLSTITETLKEDLKAQLQEQLEARTTTVLCGDQSLGEFQQQQDQRLAKLESGFSELTAQGAQMSRWCEAAATRMSAQETQLDALKVGLQQNQADIQHVRAEVQQSHEQLNTSLHQSFGNMKQELTSEFASNLTQHMDRFERLILEKNPRRFWPWGEALNPGPPPLCIGFSNPSGLRGKESHALAMGPGIWNFSETQLSHVTQRSCSTCLRSLAVQEGRDLRIHMGEPVATRANSQWAGTWSGVCTFSDFPSREVALAYGGERSCGRVLTTQHFVRNFAVLVSSVYGYPRGPTWPNARQLTEDLVSVLSREVVLGASGPRIIGGDFNCGDNDLEAFRLWHRMGWRSAQDFAWEMWGVEKKMTCKAATEPDLVWLSPEALALLTKVRVHDVFMEHSTVQVGLAVPFHAPMVLAWPLPSPIPWDSVQPSWSSDFSVPTWTNSDDIDASWAEWGSSFETSLAGHVTGQPLDSLTHAQRGRCQSQAPLLRPMSAPLAKPSRPSEVTLRNDLAGAAVRSWFKQLRRLQSYHHAIAANKQTPDAICYRLELWTSIVRARGFRRSFSHWWTHLRTVRAEGCPSVLPRGPPVATVARAIFEVFRVCFERFERWHLRQRATLLKHQYSKSLDALYRDLKPPKRERLDFLKDQTDHQVVIVDAATCQVHVDPAVQDLPSTWTWDGDPLQVRVLNTHTLELLDPAVLPETGHVLTQHSGSTQGSTLMRDLRAAAMQALGLNKAGANSLLRLTLSGWPTADPGYWRLRMTVRSFRRLAAKEPSLIAGWKLFVDRFDGQLLSGPFTQLILVLNQIGWTVCPPFFVDHDGFQHDLLQLDTTALDELLWDGWLQHVATEVGHRKDFHDLDGLDPTLAAPDSNKLSGLELALQGALQSGAFMTSSSQSKFDVTKQPRCIHCDEIEDQSHWLVCPLKSHLQPPVVEDTWVDRTQALRAHLLPSRSPWVVAWKRVRLQVPDTTKEFHSQPCGPEQHLFTDGAATTGLFPMASWGCINASTGQVVAAGHVPGLSQTSPRAELYAVIAALEWATCYRITVHLWCDNQKVIDSLRVVCRHGVVGPWVHQDLWSRVLDLVQSLELDSLILHWIPSHLDASQMEDGYEDWICRWNHAVDHLAGYVNHCRPADFLTVRRAAIAHHTQVAKQIAALREFYGRIAAESQTQPGTVFSDDLGHVEDFIVQPGQVTLIDLFPDRVFDLQYMAGTWRSDGNCIAVPRGR